MPDADEVAVWAPAQGLPAKLPDLGRSKEGRAKLLAALTAQVKAASKEAKLAGFEIPKRLHLEIEPWSVDNGMLTPTFKMKRNDLKKRYQAVLDDLYAQGVPSAAPASKL